MEQRRDPLLGVDRGEDPVLLPRHERLRRNGMRIVVLGRDHGASSGEPVIPNDRLAHVLPYAPRDRADGHGAAGGVARLRGPAGALALRARRPRLRSSTGSARTSRTTPSSSTAGRSSRTSASTPARSSCGTRSRRWTPRFASEHYRQAVVADEHSLIDKSRFLLLLAERRVLPDGEPPADAVKLLTYLPARRALDHRGSLRDARAARTARSPPAARPLRHEQLLELPGAHDGRLPAVFRPSTSSGSATPADAVGFVHGELGHRAGYALAGTAFGLERLVARPFRVV